MKACLEILLGAIIVILALAIFIGGFFGISALFNIPEVRVFNAAYGTNYTAIEWTLAEDVIKDYIGVGKVQRLDVGVKVAQ